MACESDGGSSDEYFVPILKNTVEKHAVDATHSIEGVRTLFMMHEAMSELRAELIKKDLELLALKRDLEHERTRGLKLASEVGKLRKTVHPSSIGSAASRRVASGMTLMSMNKPVRHSCSVQYAIDADRVDRSARIEHPNRCVKRGIWEVAAMSRYFSKRHGPYSSLPDVNFNVCDEDEVDECHSTCSTTSILAAAESYKAIVGREPVVSAYLRGSAPNLNLKRVDKNDARSDEFVASVTKNGEFNVPFQPRKAQDIAPGSRVKYFHPSGRVLAGTVMQVGCLNGGPEMWVWCTREHHKSESRIVAVPWTKVIVCYQKHRRSTEE